MAQLRLTKKGIIFLIVILSLVFYGLGFGIWQLVGPKTFQPTDSSAGSTGGGGYCTCDQKDRTYGTCGASQANLQDVKCFGVVCGNRPCGTGMGRYQCCNGTWVVSNDPETACKNRGGYNNCTKNAQKCYCKSYTGCGVDCTFPPGTQGKVDKKAKGTCDTYMAMCVVDSKGNTTITIEKAGACLKQQSICKNPVATDKCTPATNVCDGGKVTSPANLSDYNVGDKVTIKGYAYDKNGVNKSTITVTVDGTEVGKAVATNHSCTTGSTDPICVAADGAPAVDWEYTYTISKQGELVIGVSWEDTKGVTGNSCEGSRTITSNIQGNPNWEISKTGSTVCIDETAGSQIARVDYSIVVRNVGDLAGQLVNLVDKLDSKVQTSYIQSDTINPDATVSTRTITWDLSGSLGTFNPDQQKSFRYSIEIPQSAFGQYTNTATATPESGDAFKAVEVVYASCSAPDTGIFDSAISKVILGVILITISAGYLYSEKGLLTLGKIKKTRKENFEERIVAGK